MKKKYQVFISSTYTDLKEERDAVRDSILRIHHIPVGMEQFNAGNEEQWEVIKDFIDTSDYYILIIGKRYGSVIGSGEDTGISYTEKEFNYAFSQGIPVLAFIKSDNANYRGTEFETDSDKNDKLKVFTEKVKTGRVVEWFDNRYELATKVTAALYTAIDKNDRPGWVRGNQSDIEVKIDELIKLLKNKFEYEIEADDSDDDWDEPVKEYEFKSPRFPTDGNHKEIGWNGAAIGEGEYIDGKLINGTKYDVLIHVVHGRLIFKPDFPEDPYDSSEDFKYERLEPYGWSLGFTAFGMSENYILEDGMESYYVVDFKVTDKTEQMTNIRTLEKFLEEKDPEQLKHLHKCIGGIMR